ncbi:hypothetical protein CH306_28375 [Rhodococcus sp. 15-725-2-2b]|uniref:SMP-30/gluconolactonase/LRE family protein n=1 Tax=unclassified Rhodococcus (in: high G+C Gram-positive bacteria) TaxID=192944 RepID=UPI000B9AE5A1|nr:MULTISPECIES: SMP-30/gluconolactonase/LRE family protein [unclassified Rhodococcus (in: high G+C Gram-positive bacteria)]OZC63031.1 hypothetical protein CH277_24305 [Rhodococcus sp. 06-469-3-2]OZD41431.1 hypothetical protein CH264_23375 [Rhodococcus sp. 06-1477-1A]OZE06945.1 hypothetical protein CH249_20100 [Rhodococcus sp. 05-2255-3B1]OZE12773.1 hypothetical protein CH255_26150 [Rhodococcus sp. 05-2255-2A2]OZE16949.1 hypothetical protein CH250_00700 [Rhodococcus sp. 05-2255-3C]
MNTPTTSTTVVSGFAFTECPRWHEDRLWFVDMHLEQIVVADVRTGVHTVIEVPGSPGGIDWLPDGRLLVVMMEQRQILRRENDGWAIHADLSATVPTTLNDMVVDASGRCYVGETGFDPHDHLSGPDDIARVSAGTFECPVLSRVFVVDLDGSYREAASGIAFSNGIVIDDRTRQLFVAESFGSQLSRFDIAPDGTLIDRVRLPLGFAPDGIGLDGWGCIWVSDVFGNAAQRVTAAGTLLERVPTQQLCLACVVGGPSGNDLLLCSSPTLDRTECLEKLESHIESTTIGPPETA